MKSKFIFLVLIFIFIIPFSYANCYKNAEIDLNLASFDLTSKEISIYGFPEFKQGDILIIKELKILNKGNCNITNPNLKIVISNEKGTNKEQFLIWSGIFNGITINSNKSYSIKYLDSVGNLRYVDSYTNKTFALNGLELDQLGVWKVEISISDVSSQLVDINGAYLNQRSFNVLRPSDLYLRELTKETNDLGKKTNQLATSNIYLAIYFGVLTIVTSIAVFWGSIKYDDSKNIKNQENLLKALLLDLAKVAENSESYKDVFIQNILKNKSNYENNEKIKEILKIKFKEYLKLEPDSDNIVEDIHKILEKDKKIVLKIKELCEYCKKDIDKIQLQVQRIYLKLQYYSIRQIDNNFYSKQLESKIYRIGTIDLKNALINLSAVIEVINFQVNYLNDWYQELYGEKTGYKRWNEIYYSMFENLEDLDKKLCNTLKELLKFKTAEKYFQDKTREESIEILNRVYERSK